MLETYLIPIETPKPGGEGGKGEAFRPGIGYASNLTNHISRQISYRASLTTLFVKSAVAFAGERPILTLCVKHLKVQKKRPLKFLTL